MVGCCGYPIILFMPRKMKIICHFDRVTMSYDNYVTPKWITDETTEEFFKMFDHSRWRCDCGQFCHKRGRLGASMLIDPRMVPEYFARHSEYSVDRAMSVLGYPYAIDKPMDPISSSPATDEPTESYRFGIRRSDAPDEQLCTLTYFIEMESIPYQVDVTEEVVVGSHDVEVEEPVYETRTVRKEVEEQVTVPDTRIITERVRVETPRVKKVPEPRYNTWSKKMETYWRTECYTDVSYKEVRKPITCTRVEKRKKTIEVPEQVQTGTRKVTKSIPDVELVTKQVTRYRSNGKYVTYPFNLVVTKACDKCVCLKCRMTGWLPWS